ncbi:MAG: phage tail protein [Thermomicrobia bacterium]|nr:phage tail protein [Thermomicrobia bacterium]
MAGERKETLVTAFFGVDFGKHLSGPFKSVDGLERKVEVVKLTQATKEGKSLTKHVMGNTTLGGELTLKRAMTANMEMWDWRKLVEEGKMKDARVNGTITLYDSEGKATAEWNVTNAWPSSVSGPDISAKSNEAAIETVVIVHEGLMRTK